VAEVAKGEEIIFEEIANPFWLFGDEAIFDRA
jgi:hypothetical protein